MAGTTLAGGRYVLLSQLGGGQFGQVWHARDEDEADEVAIKLLDPPVTVDQVLVEARILARLRDHPRVVPIRNVSLSPPVAFIVMRYFAAGSVERQIARGAATIVEGARWARDALDGLAHVHSLGILHRDLKPANLLIDGAGRAVLSDFGLSEDTVRNVLSSTSIYVPHAAPEVLSGSPSSIASDIWAMGCTLYRLLTGEFPFADVADIAAGQYVDLWRLDAQLPTSISRVVRRALAVNPAERYSDARAMLHDLTQCRIVNSWEVDRAPDAIIAWTCRTSDGVVSLDVRRRRSSIEVTLRLDRGRGARARVREAFPSEGLALRRARTLLATVVQGNVP